MDVALKVGLVGVRYRAPYALTALTIFPDPNDRYSVEMKASKKLCFIAKEQD